MRSDEEGIEIRKHGNTYNEQETLDDKYPFQLCPECQSQDTKIVKYDKDAWYQTGDIQYKRKGIFGCQIVHVNHMCKTCKCHWTHTYENKKEKSSIEIDHYVACWIICLLVFALALTSCICAWIVVDPRNSTDAPWYQWVWALVSTVITVGSGIGVLSCYGL